MLNDPSYNVLPDGDAKLPGEMKPVAERKKDVHKEEHKKSGDDCERRWYVQMQEHGSWGVRDG